MFRFTGTIVGVADFSSQWRDSTRRSLKVQWDEPTSIMRPEKVSPWGREPFVASSVDMQQPTMKIKRPRPLDPPLTEGTAASPLCYSSSATCVELSQLTCTVNVKSGEKQIFWPQKRNDLSSCHPYSTSYPAGVWPSVSHVNGSSRLFQESMDDKKTYKWNCIYIEGIKRFETASTCRLFGIDLMKNLNKIIPHAKELSCAMTSRYEGNGDTTKEKKNVQSEGDPAVKQQSVRSRIKVQMQRIGVGRGVDLSAFGCYDELIGELEKMFGIKDEVGSRKKWQVVYIDNEGDMMLVGDEPWQEFCKMARKICIYSMEQVKKMNTRSRIGGGTLV